MRPPPLFHRVHRDPIPPFWDFLSREADLYSQRGEAMLNSTTARVQREIIRLCHAGLDSEALRLAFIKEFRKVVPVGPFWAATIDPDTMLFTGSVIEGIPEHMTSA